MKTTLLSGFVLAVAVATTSAQGAAGVIVKQRAKEVRDQSNVRQGVPAPVPTTSSAQPGQGAAATPAANAKQRNIALLRTDLAALSGKADAAATVKQRFARNLMEASQGSKPAAATVTRVAENLAGVLTANAVEPAEQARLAVDLNALFDSTNLATDRVNAILSDVQAILQVGGARRQLALGVVDDLRSVVTEIQSPAAR